MVRVPPRPYRLLVERLEDRLPPGDAVAAGLLAAELIPHTERAVGLVPAGSAARPALSRPLADLAFPDAETTFALLPAGSATPAAAVHGTASGADEPFAPAPAGRR